MHTTVSVNSLLLQEYGMSFDGIFWSGEICEMLGLQILRLLAWDAEFELCEGHQAIMYLSVNV